MNAFPAQRHSKTLHRRATHRTGATCSCNAPDITSRECSATTKRSKSLLGLASKPLSGRSHARVMLFYSTAQKHCTGIVFHAFLLKSLLECASKPLIDRTHCSSKLISIRQHLRFFIRYPFRNHSASKCALMRALLYATSQAPYCATRDPSICIRS